MTNTRIPSAVSLDVDTLARALPNVMDAETCAEVYGEGFDPLDIHDEWYMTPRDLARAIIANLTEAAKAEAFR